MLRLLSICQFLSNNKKTTNHWTTLQAILIYWANSYVIFKCCWVSKSFLNTLQTVWLTMKINSSNLAGRVSDFFYKGSTIRVFEGKNVFCNFNQKWVKLSLVPFCQHLQKKNNKTSVSQINIVNQAKPKHAVTFLDFYMLFVEICLCLQATQCWKERLKKLNNIVKTFSRNFIPDSFHLMTCQGHSSWDDKLRRSTKNEVKKWMMRKIMSNSNTLPLSYGRLVQMRKTWSILQRWVLLISMQESEGRSDGI